MEWLLLGAALGGGLFAWRWIARAKSHGRWKALLHGVAAQLEGRASPSADGPELRAEADGQTVTLKLVDYQKSSGHVVAVVPLPDRSNTVRFYVGWDVPTAPAEVAHIPVVPSPGGLGLDGQVEIRAENAALALRFVPQAALALEDVRQKAGARGLMLTTKGGYLTLTLLGLQQSPELLAQTVRVTAKLAVLIGQVSAGTSLPSATESEAPITSVIRCESCQERPQAGEPWVRCAACKRPYHAACWRQSGPCVHCGDTTSVSVAVEL